MTGYSAKTKREIAKKPFSSDAERLAFLSAVIHTAGSIILSAGGIGVEIAAEYGFVAESIGAATEALCGRCPELTGRGLRLSGDYVAGLLVDAGILSEGGVNAGAAEELLRGEAELSAYIRGAFLGSGSVSILGSGYHLEFALSSERLARDLSHILGQFGILSRTTRRKDKTVLYIKDSESISDCLALMGAGRAAIVLNEEIVRRQVSREVNRAFNCDMANLNKTVDASLRQIEAIRYLKKKHALSSLDERLVETAEARLSNENASYGELAQMLNISKSGLKHRLEKLTEYAEKLKK